MTDTPPAHTKTAHSLPGDFENATCERSKMIKMEHFSRLSKRGQSTLYVQVHFFGIKLLGKLYQLCRCQISYRFHLVPASCERYLKVCYRHTFQFFQNSLASRELSQNCIVIVHNLRYTKKTQAAANLFRMT